jgi:hypothetical protein
MGEKDSADVILTRSRGVLFEHSKTIYNGGGIIHTFVPSGNGTYYFIEIHPPLKIVDGDKFWIVFKNNREEKGETVGIYRDLDKAVERWLHFVPSVG